MLLVHWLKSLHNRCFRPLSRRVRTEDARRRSLRGTGERRTANIARAESLEDRTLLASFTVDIATDVVNTNFGAGDLSLREAIMLANTDGGTDSNDNDIINFAPALANTTITLGGTQLTLTDTTGSIAIVGLGASQLTVSGNNASRVFLINANVTAEISGLTLTNGRVGSGAGIANLGNLTLTESVVSNNSALSASGGGIRNTTNGTLLIQRSTIHNNRSSDGGGGIANASTGGSLTILNSTISQNSAFFDGGGIEALSGTVTTIVNSTITQNVADSENDGTGVGGGIHALGNETVVNTIIAGNLVATSSVGTANVGGTLNISTNNIISNTASAYIDSALADNGGPTPTHRLVFDVSSDNDAIDGGNNTLATTNGLFGGPPLLTDQRGQGRFLDGDGNGSAIVDVGAYEFVPSAPPVLADLTASVTFLEDDVNAQAQLIDTSITVSDPDSPNFVGGRLFISYEGTPGATEESLGIRNQGSDPGEIDVVGTDVRFGGVVIGTIGNGGQNGAPIAIFLNANATPAAVEALLENLTYRNTSDTPALQRTISILIQDGAGGETTQLVEVNITPQGDPINVMEVENNNTPGTAQFIAGFGTGFGESRTATITGTQTFDPGVTIVPVGADPGDSIGTAFATGLTTGGFVRYEGLTIGDGTFGATTGDFDFFAVNAAAGQELFIEVDTGDIGSSLDSIIGIYNSAGELLYYNDDGLLFFATGEPFDASARFVTPTAGTYYVAVGGRFAGPPVDFPSDPNTPGSSAAGIGSTGAYTLRLLLDNQDQDFYSVHLEAGDILGVGNSLFSAISIRDPNNVEMMGSFFDLSGSFSTGSPLPGGDVNAAIVASVSGTYTVGLSFGSGPYTLDLQAFRPVLEEQPGGTRQVLYLDFDGATLNPFSIFGTGPNTNATLSGLNTFLDEFGLTAGDEDAVIDAIIAEVTAVLETDLAAFGLNPNFDIDIINSRDHADFFGLYENVSRIIIGGTISELGIATLGIAESLDVGNFDTSETAVVLLDILSGPGGLDSINAIPGVNLANKVAAIGKVVGQITAHEAAHFFGSFHTENSNPTHNTIDRGGNGVRDEAGVGPDGEFGTPDDVNTTLTKDFFTIAEGLTGIEDARNIVAFGLSTGTAQGVYFNFVNNTLEVTGNAGDGDADEFQVTFENGNIVIRVNGEIVHNEPPGTMPIVLNGSSDDDTFVIDFDSLPIPMGGLQINGGGQGTIGDALVLSGGSFTSAEYILNADNTGNGTSGSINYNGGATEITFTGLEPVDATGVNTADVTFTIDAGVTDAVLEDFGANNDGDSQLRFTSNSAEDVIFSNPTNSLTINLQGSSTVTLGVMDQGYAPNTVTFNGMSGPGNLFQIMTGAANNTVLPDSSNLVLSGNATLDLNDVSDSIGSLTGDTGTSVLLGTGTLTTGGNNASTTYAGTISESGGLVKTGSGQMGITGVNNYTGTTTIVAGSINLGGAGTLGDLTNGTTVQAGGTLAVLTTTPLNEMLSLAGTGSGIGGALLGFDGTIVAGNITLAADATIAISNSGSTMTISGDISGVGTGLAVNAFMEAGRTLVLSGNNTYTGTTNVNSGTLSLVGGAAIDNSGAVIIANGAILNLANSETIGSLAGNGSVTLNANTLTTGGNNSSTTYAGTISGSGGGAALAKLGSGTFTLSGNNTYTGTTFIDEGAIQIQHANALGVGTGTINGTNVASGAALEITGNLVGVPEIIFLAGGTLRNVSGSNFLNGPVGLVVQPSTIESVSGTLTLTSFFDGNSGTLTVDGAGDTNLLGGSEPASSDLIKNGTGTLTLGGMHQYGGATQVNNGTLLVTGTVTSSNFTVNTNGTLGGTGSIAGSVNVNGGTLAPGLSPGQLSTGNLSFSPTGTFEVELNGPNAGTDYDQVIVTGSVMLNNAVLDASRLTTFIPTVGQTFTIIDNDDTDLIPDTFSGLADNATFLIDGVLFRIDYDGGSGNDVVLTVQAPPIVYVDDDFANPTLGEDPDGAGPAMVFGYDAFETIQEGVDQVAAGGMVIVNAGTYLESVTINKSLTLDGNTGIATDVTITPPAGDGITLTNTASNVVLSDFQVLSAAGDGILAIGQTSLSVTNVRVINSGGDGLDIDTLGDVMLTNVVADGNTGRGVNVEGPDTAGVDLTITGGSYSGNTLRGIEVFEMDTVTVTNVTANGSQYGFDALNVGSVNITGGSFSGSTIVNINAINVTGQVSVDNVTADNAQGTYGIIVSQAQSFSAMNSSFSGNADVGLLLDNFTDSVTLTNVTADNNGDTGFDLVNADAVTVTGGSFVGNAQNGIELFGVGPVTITNAIINSNSETGVLIEESDSVAITGSTIAGNAVGVFLDEVTTGSILNSFVTGNGIGLQVANGLYKINQSDLSGNTTFIQNDSASIVDAGFNFFNFGIADDNTILAKMTGTGPGVDFTPYLNSGDADAGTPGFQANLSVLNVSSLGQQIGLVGRIQEAVDALTQGGTINLSDGTFLESVSINKSLTLIGSGPVTILDAGTADGITILDGASALAIQNLRITNAGTGIRDASVATISSLSLSNLVIDGSTQGGSLDGITALNVTLTGNADIANIDGTQFNSTGLQSIAYANVGTFVLNGDAGSDTFNVDPISTTNLTIDGGGPSAPANPGDTLNYNGPGLVSFNSPNSGNISQPMFNLVVFTGMETVTTDFIIGNNGNFIVTAGADANDGDGDDFIFRLNALGNLEVVVLDDFGNEQIVFTAAPALVASLRIVGSNDDNALTVDFTNGNPIPSAGGLAFTGNGDGINDNDTLLLTGGGAMALVSHQFTNANNGSITVDSSGSDPRVISYTGLEPIFDNLAAVNRVFNFAATNDAITLSDDPNGVANVSRISSASTSETVDFANPTGTLTINAGSGDDSITLLALEAAFDADITINAGLGRDTFEVEEVTANADITYTLNGNQGADTFNVAALIDGQAAVVINGDAPAISPGDTLNYDGLATIVPSLTAGSGLLDVASVTQNLDFTSIESLNLANPPQFVIDDAVVAEVNNGGLSVLMFTVRLTNGVIQPVTVDVHTGNGSALAGSDYVSNTQTLLFNPGTMSQAFNVAVLGENIVEQAESIFAFLSNANGASILDGVAVGTITNDDTATLSIGDVTAPENGQFAFTVTLSAPVQETTTVVVNTQDGSAIAGEDYGAISNLVLTFTPGGSLTQTVTVQVNDDAVVENDETFQVVLSDARIGGVDDPLRLTIADPTGDGTIQNNDIATASIDDVTQTETGAFEFTLSLSNAVDEDVTVQVDTQALSAMAGVDYTDIIAGTVTFTAGGSLTETLTVTVLDESIVENDETFQVVLSNVQFGGNSDPTRVVIGDDVGLGTIQNDDTATLTIDDVTEAEDGTFTFKVMLSNDIEGDLSVRVDTAPQTAGLLDYTTIINQVVTFSAGSTAGTTQDVTVTVSDDNTVETDEIFEVRLSDIRFNGQVDSSRAVIGDDVGLGTIQNNDTAEFTINDVTAPENGQFTFTVTLSQPIADAVTVAVNTLGVSAAPGSDFSPIANQVLTFVPGGALTQTVTVQVNDDAIVENDETFQVVLSDATYAGSDDPTRVTITDGTGDATIQNNDAATVSIDDVSRLENGTFEFTLSLSNAVSEDVTVQVDTQALSAMAGVDYTDIIAGTVTFTANGSLTETLTVTVLDESIVENDETFQVILSDVQFGGNPDSTRVAISDGVGVGTIQNDDTATLTIDDVTEAEDGTFTFTVTLMNSIAADAGDVTVRVDTAPQTADVTDFNTIINQVVTFGAGSASGSIRSVTVTVNDDTIVENDEVFEVRLSDARLGGVADSSRAAIGDDVGLGTIQNNDIAEFTISNVTQLEGTGIFNFTVSLSNSVAANTTVRVNTGVTGLNAALDAIEGTDFTEISDLLLTFTPNGPLTQTVSVQIADDLIVERDETFTVVLTDAQYNGVTDASRVDIADDTGLGTILNDDFATVSISDVSGTEGSVPFEFIVTLSHQISEDVTFTINTSAVTAASGVDFTAVSGQQVTFLANSLAGATQTVSVMVLHDTLIEQNETFEVFLSNFPGDSRVSVADGVGLGTIVNDDLAEIVIVQDETASEADGSMFFTIMLRHSVDPMATVLLEGSDTITVQVNTIPGSARGADVDYTTITSQLVTFGATDLDGDGNALTHRVEVQITNDTVVENTEDFSLLISDARFNGVSDPTRAAVDPAEQLRTGTILDDMDMAMLSISDFTAVEGGAFIFNVTLTGLISDEVQVTVNTDDGTSANPAQSDLDFYSISNTVLTFAAEEELGKEVQTQTVTVQVPVDGAVEPGDEDFRVLLSNLLFGGAMDGRVNFTNNEGVGTIVDSPPPAVIEFQEGSLSVSGTENDGAGGRVLEFILERTGSLAEEVTVVANTLFTNNGMGRDAAAGIDFSALNNVLVTFAAGQMTQTVSVQLTADIIVEPDETFLVRISDPRVGGVQDDDLAVLGTNIQATGTIENDDTATITITDAQVNEGDAGSSTMTFTVTLSAPVQGGVTVGYQTLGVTATAGVDFTGIVPLAFTGLVAGETRQILVTVHGDTVTERDEILNIVLGNPVAQNSSAVMIPDNTATGTILNDDSIIVSSVDAGGGPHVRAFDQLGNELLSFFAYELSFAGGVRVAVGDIDGDGTPDIITAPGTGRDAQIKVFHGVTGAVIGEFDAYTPGMTMGVFVTAADLNGDGLAEIITGPDMGGGPHVRVFDGADFSVLFEFMAYPTNFMGGVRVATGDVTGDGVLEIITGAGIGGGPVVAVFEVSTPASPGRMGTALFQFVAFEPGFNMSDGIYVAAANFGGTNAAEIIVGGGTGSRLRIWNSTGTALLEEIDVFPGFSGGVRVGTTERLGDNTPDLMAAAGPGGGPHVRVYNGSTILSPSLDPTVEFEFFSFSPGFGGGVFVAGTAIPPTSGSPLQLAADAALSGNVVGVLEDSDVKAIVSAAVARLQQAGLDSQAALRLAQTPVIVQDLGSGLLGLTQGGRIFLDDDAAGAGWFIDPTPLGDEEFQNQNATAPEALGRIDLLTVVLHELGHVLGLDDLPLEVGASDLMADTLPVGVRRLPDEETLDALYADVELMDVLLQ